jgi:hypothetical protein
LRTAAAIAALAATLGAVAWSQSLDDLAKKEKARRKAAGSAKTFTNDDLSKPSPAPSPSPTADGGGTSERRAPPRAYMPAGPIGGGRADGVGSSETASGGGEPSAGDPGAEDSWRGRAKALHDTIDKTQQSIAALEARIAQLQLDRDPNPSDQLDPNRLQKREAERLRTLEDVEKARASLAGAQQALRDLSDEARRKGAPASWVQ